MDQRQPSIEELGDRIASLAADIHAATCRWLRLVAEFDEREGWGDWGCKSCAHWISWRCSIAPGPAREHVRVARRLADLPLITEAFARGELSYSKMRAITRVEEVEREQDLLDLARSSTAAQLERIVRSYRGVVLAESDRTHERRFLSVHHDEDGSLIVRGRLDREEGAILLKALEVARDREAPTGEDVPAGTSSAEQPDFGARNADALVSLADATLSVASAERSGGDRFQVVVHVDAAALTASDERDAAARSEICGGPIATETARRLCCDASVVALVERGGKPLSVGRKTRSIPPALQRALRSRDGGCQFPGCTQHRWVDAHHIEHWAHGGETCLDNLVQLCRHHHRLVHEGGFSVERRATGRLLFRRPDGRALQAVPRAPRRGDPGCMTAANRRSGAHVTPTTCVPDWYGDRLDLAAATEAVLAAAPLAKAPPEPLAMAA